MSFRGFLTYRMKLFITVADAEKILAVESASGWVVKASLGEGGEMGDGVR